MFIFDKKIVLAKEIHNRKIKVTADGSHTFVLPDWKEHYHSVNGAISESRHVFIKNGLAQQAEGLKEYHILEVGFGTGLNALLSLEYGKKKALRLNYLGLEPYPFTLDEVKRLNYPKLVSGGIFSDVFMQMHELPFGKIAEFSKGFTFSKWQIGLDLAPLASSSFHLVYHDAFAPQFQPQLWDEAAFGELYKALRTGGVLTTYSAKGSVKRALRACGFSIEHPPGPAVKREITVALKQ